MDIRIGIIQSARELELDLGDDATVEAVKTGLEAALGTEGGVWWIADKKGREIAVPVARIAYVEIGGDKAAPRIGFGA
ncbi:MAG: DUF3107 domain-containing protein [Microthrixaceae bacterium]|nr:DUF3107 domain-containing protein [Microthrixaceae bacterium]MCO5313506.1 DUF3107 domain-containing protein [Microthrixaceae bacterium]